MKELALKFSGLVDRLSDLMCMLGGIMVAIMTLIVTYSSLARYFFNAPVGWSEEASIYLMIWGIYLGIAATFKDDKHVAVDVVMEKLSPRHQRWAHWFHYSAALVFLIVLFWKGVDMVRLSHGMDSRSIATEFPLHFIELAVPVGVLLLILQVFAKLLKLAVAERGAP